MKISESLYKAQKSFQRLCRSVDAPTPRGIRPIQAWKVVGTPEYAIDAEFRRQIAIETQRELEVSE